MTEYLKMLHEIEEKKQKLEERIAAAVQNEISKWNQENDIPVQSVYVDLVQRHSLGSSKSYEVSRVSVDLDYKP